MDQKLLGKKGEETATDFLKKEGYQILDTNFHKRSGEIDIIAFDSNFSEYVFVEVKTRSSTTFGFPEESITVRKQAHMLAAAESYIQEHPDLGNDWRIDVIAILCQGSTKKHSLKHFENVIT